MPSRPPRAGAGSALWALGFRPFYLLAGLLAALSVPAWALQWIGWLPLPALRGPLGHAHEMLFGFTLAVMVGFLFTAGRNWSGQPTPSGRALQMLALLWLAARMLGLLPWTLAAMVANVAFAWASAWALGRALVAGGNRRNYFFVALLVAMGVISGAVHAAQMGWLSMPGPLALQVGLDVVLFVMAVMAGRVVPMFTNNGVPGANATRHPRVEQAALGSVLALLALDAGRTMGLAVPVGAIVLLASAAALIHAWRWWLWQPWTTRRTPLVWILHLAYAWIPVHLALRAVASALGGPEGAAVHALTAGAIGLLTLAMMTRTARGHTGRPLRADRVDVTSYGLVAAAAVLRTAAPLLWPAALVPAVLLSALAWSAGWALFTVHYAPWLTRPRADGLAG